MLNGVSTFKIDTAEVAFLEQVGGILLESRKS